MLQTGVLAERFGVYWREMKKCRQHKAYWTLLHVTVCLPDICAALESPNGRSKGDKYEKWCDRFAADPLLTGEERWNMRCRVLHEGRAQSRTAGRYSAFTFSQPATTGETDHKRVEGVTLHLDVGRFAAETVTAVEQWIKWVEANAGSSASRAVEANLPSLVSVNTVPVVKPTGIIFQSFRTN